MSTILALELIAGCDGDRPQVLGAPGDLAAAAACASPSRWTPLFCRSGCEARLERSVLAITGRTDDDVFLAGGGLGPTGAGALVLHWDGGSFREESTDRLETLRGIWTAPGVPETWFVGDHGLVLVRNEAGGFLRLSSRVDVTLRGVWGSGPDDVWIVGGEPGEGGPDDVVLHWNGAQLDRVMLPAARGAALFDVWGPSADEVWLAGEAGTLWRRRAGLFTNLSRPTATALLGTDGCRRTEAYAVGEPNLYLWNGETLAFVDVDLLSGGNAVMCRDEGVLVVGNRGLRTRFDRVNVEWVEDDPGTLLDTTFTGTWISPSGVEWAVGESVAGADSLTGPRGGVIAVRGCPAGQVPVSRVPFPKTLPPANPSVL